MISKQKWRSWEGRTIDTKYYLEEFIDSGGYGGVFRAAHIVQDRQLREVALKLIEQSTDPEECEQQSAELSHATVRHPHILECYDVGSGTVEGNEISIDHHRMLYLVMEIADRNLRQHRGNGIVQVGEARTIINNIASALLYLHEQGLVHRDVKPANIFFAGQWKLGDFGLLKSVPSGEILTDNPIGTAEYSPPEVFDGIISTAFDTWAIGVVTVELLTGTLPFSAPSSQTGSSSTPRTAPFPRSAILKNLARETKQRMGLKNLIKYNEPFIKHPLPSPFDEIAMGCLQKDRNQRLTARQILDILSRPQYTNAKSTNTQSSKNARGNSVPSSPQGSTQSTAQSTAQSSTQSAVDNDALKQARARALAITDKWSQSVRLAQEIEKEIGCIVPLSPLLQQGAGEAKRQLKDTDWVTTTAIERESARAYSEVAAIIEKVLNRELKARTKEATAAERAVSDAIEARDQSLRQAERRRADELRAAGAQITPADSGITTGTELTTAAGLGCCLGPILSLILTALFQWLVYRGTLVHEPIFVSLITHLLMNWAWLLFPLLVFFCTNSIKRARLRNVRDAAEQRRKSAEQNYRTEKSKAEASFNRSKDALNKAWENALTRQRRVEAAITQFKEMDQA